MIETGAKDEHQSDQTPLDDEKAMPILLVICDGLLETQCYHAA